jgi:hypothetical protein
METIIAPQEKQTMQAPAKKSSVAFMISLSLFLIVLIGTIGLKLYVYALDHKLESMNTEMIEMENTIAQTKQKNPQVNAYSLWSKAKNSIEAQIQKSEAQRYLARLDIIARAFYRKVAFSGFHFAEGKIDTHAVAFGTTTDAAMNIIELLRNYRGTPSTPDALFDLTPILSFDGEPSRREFSVTFLIKNQALLPLNTTLSGSTNGTGAIQ